MYSYNHPASSWGNPAFSNNNIPPNHDPRQRAFTTPPRPFSTPYPPSVGLNGSHLRIPPSLTPGGRPHAPPSHRQDLLFQNHPNVNGYHGFGHPSGAFAPAMPTHPPYQQQYIHPAPPPPAPPIPPSPRELHNRPRSKTTPPRVLHKPPPLPPPNSRPQIPPKISLYPQSVQSSQPAPSAAVPRYPQSIPATVHMPTPQFIEDEDQSSPATTNMPTPQFTDDKERSPTDLDDLAFALAISASEPAYSQELLEQEEAELARALEASLALGPQHHYISASERFQSEFQSPKAGPSTAAPETRPSTYANEPGASAPYFRSPHASFETQVPPTNRTAQISKDEAFARHLMLQDEQEEVGARGKAIEAQEEVFNAQAIQPPPPRYVDIIKNPFDMSPDTSPLPTSSPSSVHLPLPTPQPGPSSVLPPATVRPVASIGKIRPAASPAPPASISETSSLQRSVSSTSTSSSALSLQEQSRATFAIGSSPPRSVSDDTSHLLTSATTDTNSVSQRETASRSLPSLAEASETGSSPETPSAPNINQYVDPHLLRGVSIGFTIPSISNSMAVMQGGMPNAISLGFGRCRPFHLQAPTWRQLLKLMARMSTTRIEPSVEAMSLSKIEFKLRTVIQFVRVYHTSSDWRTILWLTVDHPVPPAAPGASKYTNGDVNMLPWSYTLSNLPALLRDGADTAMSKAYTIPSTPSTPYPSLPINLPNMAMYLQAALEESRRAMHDSTGGLRKLAKMVDSCYPNEHYDDGSGPEKTTVGGLFKRVIGRGNNKARGVNEDMFELVTPFVSEDWG